MRNLLARKIRLALSAFAIVLGVAFVAGSFIMTDTMKGAFDGIIKGTTADVQVAPHGAGDWDSAPDSRTIPASVVDDLSKLPGASEVHGSDQVMGVYVIGADGKLVGGNAAPGMAFNYNKTRAITGNPILSLAQGKLPTGAHQIALDESTADKAGYDIGDQVTLVTPGDQPTMQARLTGLMKFGEGGGMAGATITIFDQQAIQQLFFDGKNVFSSISLTTSDGVSQEQLRDAAAKVLPAGLDAQTGDEAAAENQKMMDQILGFINKFLLVFAAISLVVGIFLIINTFSILVAQRSRELALLRAMGASKRQVNRSVLGEAVAVGLIGSTVGIGVGYLLAIGLKALFGAFGLDLSGADMPVAARTVAISYAVGLVVTMVAAYLPARRASRIAPVEAMRDDVAMSEGSLRRRMVIGGLMVVAGVAAIVGGFLGSGGAGLAMIGIGALVVLIGVSLGSPVLGRPVIHVLGAVYRRVFGTVGRLATENSLRNPRRTAATASALMIGLTLVAMMSVFGSSAKASTDKAVASALTADFVVTDGTGSGFSPSIADRIRKVDSVETVAEFRQGPATIDGDKGYVGAADPHQLSDVLDVPMQAGALSALADRSILVGKSTAKSRGYEVGDSVDLKMQAGTQHVRVAGVFEASAAVPANYIVTLHTLAEGGLQPRDAMLFVTPTPGASDEAVEGAVNRVTKDLPTLTVNTPSQFSAEQSKQIDQMLYMIYAMLGLAIVIAILGIVNTLALSVIERTREVGLLRAIGLSRRQLRRMVRLESVVIAVLGAVLGVVMGIAFGISLVEALGDQGLNVLSVPWTQLVVFVVLAGLVGVLAAVLPARRAAKLNVLRAITTE